MVRLWRNRRDAIITACVATYRHICICGVALVRFVIITRAAPRKQQFYVITYVTTHMLDSVFFLGTNAGTNVPLVPFCATNESCIWNNFFLDLFAELAISIYT